MDNIIETIKEIYPDIEGGFVYWTTKEDGSAWENPIDGLIWNNTEFSKPDWETIELKSLEVNFKNSIEYKLQQLDNYHYNSSEIREMKINDYFILSLSGDGRALIAEQIQSLEQQIKLNVITEESATFEYFYNGGSIEITLVQLRQLYIFMLNVVNTNYGVYKAHIHAIKNLSTIEEVEAYDFTANYLKNQNLNIE
jgi:hypothetical protein